MQPQENVFIIMGRGRPGNEATRNYVMPTLIGILIQIFKAEAHSIGINKSFGYSS